MSDLKTHSVHGLQAHTGGALTHDAAQTETLRPDLAKADSTRVAQAALAGIELVRLADGSWAASRWGLIKCLADRAEVDRWLAQIAGQRA